MFGEVDLEVDGVIVGENMVCCVCWVVVSIRWMGSSMEICV